MRDRQHDARRARAWAASSRRRPTTTRRPGAAATATTVCSSSPLPTSRRCVDLVMEAFEAADYYRNPVMVLGDGMIGQMMEPVVLHEPKRRELPPKDWATTGTGGRRAPNIINSLYIDPARLEQLNQRLQAEIRRDAGEGDPLGAAPSRRRRDRLRRVRHHVADREEHHPDAPRRGYPGRAASGPSRSGPSPTGRSTSCPLRCGPSCRWR